MKNNVTDFFINLNERNIKYVLLRNINHELPCHLQKGKDIDVLVSVGSRNDFHKHMCDWGAVRIKHPWDFGENFIFLYSMHEFEFYKKGDLLIDVCFELSCRSMNNQEWIPLDLNIQNSVWENRKMNKNGYWYEMQAEDQIIHLVTRSIFDKNAFHPGYRTAIRDLQREADKTRLLQKMELVFFRFAPRLLKHLEQGDFENIITDYIQFSAY